MVTSRSAAIVAAGDRINDYSPEGTNIRFSPKISRDEAEQMLALTRTNMKSFYDACHEEEWKWSDEDKLMSFLNPKSRFLIVEETSVGITAFVCFRFLVDAKRPVVYIYELQVDPQRTSQGLGRRLLKEVEGMCKQHSPGISDCMLTCFRKNERALRFYNNLGFKEDKTSPSSGCSYIILSRPF
jgi:ribosomal protein S18 acetylase RimI-like enzyme